MIDSHKQSYESFKTTTDPVSRRATSTFANKMSPRPSVRNKNRNQLLIIVQQATRRAYITANFERATSKALAMVVGIVVAQFWKKIVKLQQENYT